MMLSTNLLGRIVVLGFFGLEDVIVADIFRFMYACMKFCYICVSGYVIAVKGIFLEFYQYPI